MIAEFEIRKQIVEIGKRMWQKGFVASNDGNITIRVSDDELLTTPTGVSKGFMTEEMIIKCNMKGEPLNRYSKYKPTSELLMHIEVYKERSDIKAVVHAHPIYATSFAVAGIPLDKCILPEAAVVLGAVKIAPFGLPSTNEIPERINPIIKNSDAILLANHGALTMGMDLFDAYYKMETLEHSAHIIWNAIQLGNVNVLPDEERDRLLTLRERYNLQGKIIKCESISENEKVKANCTCSSNNNETKHTEQTIKEITESVLSKLKIKDSVTEK